MVQQEGPGWRLARDPSRGAYPVLIGGEGWAIELTESEWRDLGDLVSDLDLQHRELVDQLMEEEAIELELERGVWWGCLSGDRHTWTLTVLLSPLPEPWGGRPLARAGGRSDGCGHENPVGHHGLISGAYEKCFH